MKTNLAYIDEQTSLALKQEREKPRVPLAVVEEAHAKTAVVVAGFAIEDPAVAEKILTRSCDERRHKIDAFRQDRNSVRDLLSDRNITPLAIVPKTAWERLCAVSELFRIAPDKEGTILISDAPVDAAKKEADTPMAFILLIPIVSALGSAGTFLYMVAKFTWWRSIIYAIIIAFIVLACWAFVLFRTRLGMALKTFFAKKFLRRTTLKPWKEQLDLLLPGGTSPEKSDIRVQIILPTPPQEIQKVLLKAKNLKPNVAAVSEAIGFATSPYKLLTDEFNRRVENGLYGDPIVYFEYGSAVAVIAQFGDFPIEQQVVDEVINSIHLI